MQTALQQFSETQSTEPFALQNSKLLKVRLDAGTIQAKLGSMVAYQGQVSFEHAGSGGMGRLLKKAVTGEGTSLMKMSGTGEVFLADLAQDVHLLKLDNERITVNGPNLLAFDADIDCPPVMLEVASAPTFADAQAAITWSEGVSTSIRTDFKLVKNLTGRGSGESVQMAFSGSGWVLVQPSEGRVEAAGSSGGSGGGGGVLGNLLNG
jgi:uncharacterized protein (AIM24 family)